MADRVESADERALHRELQELAKKREALDSSKRRGSGAAARGATGRRSVFARLGGEPTRAAGAGRQVQLKENNARGNATRRLGKRDNEDNRQSSAVKRQRLHSAVARPEGGHHADGRAEPSRTSTAATSPSADSARAQQRKQRAVAPYAQKEGIARSRRMFGALMGHLGKAKRQIEKDTDLFKRQDTKQQEAEQREKLQSQNLENQARRDADVARLEALVTRAELDRSEQIARAKLEHLQMVGKSESQSKFLVTITSPPLCYLPARHTKETEDLVAASMEAHEAKMKASARSHEDKLRKLKAEFATKLEQLRDELDTAKKVENTKDTGEQVSSEKKDNAMKDGDEDMDEVRKESEENKKRKQVEHSDEDRKVSGRSPKASAMEVEDEGSARESVSGSEADDNAAVDTRRNNGGQSVKAFVKSDLKSASNEPRDASPRDASRKTANGSRVAQSDTEASSPSRVKAESVKGKQTKEEEAETSKQGDQPAEVTDKKKSEETESAIQSDVAAAAEDTSVKHENGNAEMVSPTKPKGDPAAHVDKMKVTELRKELKKRGLDIKGLKATLVQRLKQAMHEDDESK